MPVDFVMPALSPLMVSGRVMRWFMAAGDAVQPGDSLLLVESGGVETEIQAVAAGYIWPAAIAGQIYECGQVLGQVFDSVDAARAAAGLSAHGSPEQLSLSHMSEHLSDEDVAQGLDGPIENNGPANLSAPQEIEQRQAIQDSENTRVLASPRARATAHLLNVQLGDVTGTGPKGRVLADDVTSYVEQCATEAAAAERAERELAQAERSAQLDEAEHERVLQEQAMAEQLKAEWVSRRRHDANQAERAARARLEVEHTQRDLEAAAQVKVDAAEQADFERLILEAEAAQVATQSRSASQGGEPAREQGLAGGQKLPRVSTQTPLPQAVVPSETPEPLAPSIVISKPDRPQSPVAAAPQESELPVESTSAASDAKKLADLLGIDVQLVPSSTPGSPASHEDVAAWVRRELAATGQPMPPAARPSSHELRQIPAAVLPLTGVRGSIANRMSESLREMAQLTLSLDANLAAINAERDRRRQQDLVVPGYTAWVVAAASRALVDHPYVNSQVTPSGVAILPEVHLGISVALDEGMALPVVTYAAYRDVDELHSVVADLAGRARDGQLEAEELEGSTFSVTALGMYGVDVFTPVIDPPNTAVLGVGRLRTETEWVDGQPSPKTVMTLSLTWDHRAFDGAPAAEFAQSIVRYLENPAPLSE